MIVLQIILITAGMFWQMYKRHLRMHIQTAVDKHGFKIYPVYILLPVNNLVKINVFNRSMF